MKLIALVSIVSGKGRIAPLEAFDMADEIEAESLIARGFASQVFDSLEDAKEVIDGIADEPDGDIVPPADLVDPPVEPAVTDPVVADTVAPADETKTKKAKADAGNSN